MTSHIMENRKNFVLVSRAETSRSILPFHASYTIGAGGRMTITMVHMRIEDNGVSTGPKPIGEAREKMIPT